MLFVCCKSVIITHAQKPAAVLNIAVKNANNKPIDLIKPVNNAVFWAARKPVQLNQQGSAAINFDSTETGFVILFVQGKKIMIFIKNNDTLHVSVDTTLSNPLVFTGSNAPGQALLNLKTIPDNYSKVESLFRKDTTLQDFINHVEKEKNAKINLFGSLYDERKIDGDFFSFVRINLDYLYATVIVQKCSNTFYRTLYPRTDQDYLPVFPKEYADYWELILQYYPPDNTNAISIPSMENYVDNYLDIYLVDYQRYKAGDTAKMKHDDYLMLKLNAIRKNMKGSMSDLTEARRWYLAFIQQKFEKPLIAFYNDYAKRTSTPQYLTFLQPYYKEVVAYHTNADKPFDTQKTFVKNYSTINRFDQLTEQLKGSFYYVDIWATWCGPCKAEFKYKDALQDFFEANKIKTLYISMDLNDRDAEWKTMIKYYKLNGVHVRTNDALRDNLSATFWEGKGYAIPRYLLIGPDGTVLENDAQRPSDPEKLKAQISKYLK